MSDANLTFAEIRDADLKAIDDVALRSAAAAADSEVRVVPQELRTWLAGLRLLQGLPFEYLVPDTDLLPPESIRFFHLDRNWTDALEQGALSVGTVSGADREQLAAVHPAIREETDAEERQQRAPGGEPGFGPAGEVTGFLLRSRAVSAYPGLHVRAYGSEVGDEEMLPEDDPRRLRLLRLERLAPAVLLALFDGVPAIVHVEEPQAGLQFGVRLDAGGGDAESLAAWVPPRDPDTASDLGGEDVAVYFREEAPGVLDLQRTAAAIEERIGSSDGLNGAELALQMIRYPFRQVFGDA
ncbi:MAG TPA: hypothetical protein VFJ76_01240 [Solirubrobacterales bacterium]|nr:hypothetical protein [Solirubrobacterales bacterium]